MTAARILGLLVVVSAAACAKTSPGPTAPAKPNVSPQPEPAETNNIVAPRHRCVPNGQMTVHFYDAGQALSVLVTLPDGRRLLVDTGESTRRPGGKAWHQRVMDGLHRDLGSERIDAVWITHQHSDHVGGAAEVLGSFKVRLYVDNGLDLDRTEVVKNARDAVAANGARLHVVDPDHADSPLKGTDNLKITPILPKEWPRACPRDPNACSIALRIDYCKSSVLFTGDAPDDLEDLWELGGPVSLLQVGHHGSDTSTGKHLLEAAQPKYAVISSGKPEEGTNDGYCHPRSITIERLTNAMGGAGSQSIRAFDGKIKCEKGKPAPRHWVDIPASDTIWSTARDGDVVLTTSGDAEFQRR